MIHEKMWNDDKCLTHWEKSTLEPIKSTIDGQLYLIQKRGSEQAKLKAANILAQLSQSLLEIVKASKVHRLKQHFAPYLIDPSSFRAKSTGFFRSLFTSSNHHNPTPFLAESPIVPVSSKVTSYSINKRLIHMCLRDKLNPENFYNMNLLLMVSIHELAHIATNNKRLADSHSDDFWEMCLYLENTAVRLNIYKRLNFKTNPHNYCGMVIKNGFS